MSNEKKDLVVEAGVSIGTELLVSLVRLIFAEYRRAGMTPEQTKAALLTELAAFETSNPSDIPDV